MLNRKYIFFFLICFVFSCGLNDNLAPVPTYLILNSPKVFSVTTIENDSHKITDVWVYSDGQLQGIFPLPAKVPIIATGEESEIFILAGIRKNGIFDEPVFYPFYKAIQTKVVLEDLKEISIPLEFSYSENCIFDVNADFEVSNPLEYDLDFDGKIGLTLSSDDASLGLKSGKVELNSSNSTVEIATSETFYKNSQISGNAYIEMDYKGEAEIGIGLVTYDDFNPSGSLQYKVVVVPRAQWNKVYVDITEELSSPRLKAYKLALGLTVPLGRDSATAYIDNIKLVRF
ncbi:MAG: hypothetical protein WAT79_03365 [Saprospiraceae bacterium]